MPSMGAIDVVPDRLESWYAAKSDAEVGTTIAEQIAQQAEGLLYPGVGEGPEVIPSTFAKTAMGTPAWQRRRPMRSQTWKRK